jgi:DNA-binding transcriptional MerR regulator
MDDNLISKRELLELTGISYGALYRWKRMKLIPDEWFLRRSTYTGSETFFPREQILRRVEKIQQMKGDMSLEDIARTFDGGGVDVSMGLRDVVSRGIAGPQVLDAWLGRFGDPDQTGEADFDTLLSVSLLQKLLTSGVVDRADAFTAVELCRDTTGFSEPQLVILRKLGVTTCLLKEEAAPLRHDPDTKDIMIVSLAALSAELKERLGKEERL